MSTIRAAAYEIQCSASGDEIAAVLAFHNGDVPATIETLLEDIKFLKEQLAISQTGMSIGFTRGWQPSFERDLAWEQSHARKP